MHNLFTQITYKPFMYAIVGAVLLIVLATFQKLAIGAPLVAEGFFVPLSFGCVSGFIIGLRVVQLQKLSQQALSQVENRLLEAQRIARIGNWDWDIPTGDLWWSDEIYRIFGVEPAIFTPTYDAFLEFIHPDDRALVRQSVETALNSNSAYDIEHRIILPNGRERTVHERAEIILDADGNPVRMAGTVQDITARNTYRNEIQRLSKRLEIILKSTAEGIYGTDRKGLCTFINPAALDMLGYNSNEVVGQDQHALFHYAKEDGSFYPSDDCPIHISIEKGKTSHVANEVFWRKDGTSFPVDFVCAPLEDNGHIIGSVVAFRDDTERKQAERNVIDSRKRLAEIIWGTDIGTWEWNVQSGETTLNERWANIVGYTLEEISPVSIDTWMNFVHPDDLKISGELLEKCFSRELDFYECDARMRHKDGHWVWVLDRGKVIEWTEDGKPLRMSGTHTDISERKANMDALEKSQNDLQYEVDVKNRFFSIISHDLKSPFNSLLGMTQMMSQMADSFSKDKLVEYSTDVNEAAEKVFNLLQNLLEWSRLQMEGGKFEPQNISLHDLVDESINVLSPVAMEKNVVLTNATTKDTVFADREMVQTVIRNLITNAVKFTPSGGKVGLSSEINDDMVQVTVSDNGIGVSKEQISDIFALDQKTSTTGTAGEKGTGLGLPLCKEMLERNGGHIWVESSPGEGSRFHFTLPQQN